MSLARHSRSYASRATATGEARIDLLKRLLYPIQTTIFKTKKRAVARDDPNEGKEYVTQLHIGSRTHKTSPTGVYHPQVLDRLTHILVPVANADARRADETYRTITRAHQLVKEEAEKKRQTTLSSKYSSLTRACEALRQVSQNTSDPVVKSLYEKATYKPDPRNKATASPLPVELQGRKMNLAERTYYEARIEGLFPREFKVPTETWPTGQKWKYDWKPVGL